MLVDDREVDPRRRIVQGLLFFDLYVDSALVKNREQMGEFEDRKCAEIQLKHIVRCQCFPTYFYPDAGQVVVNDRVIEQLAVQTGQVGCVEVRR